jgi:hypothetical protein
MPSWQIGKIRFTKRAPKGWRMPSSAFVFLLEALAEIRLAHAKKTRVMFA